MSSEVVAAIIAAGASIVTLVFGPLIIEWFQKRKNRDPLKEAIQINTLITGKLDEIKELHKIDKIWLCQFHNGGNFYPTGKSIQKFTMVYELLNPVTIESQQHQFQGIPTGLFSKAINQLGSGETIKIEDFKKNDTYGLDLLNEGGSKSSYIFPIISITNKFIGFVGIDYAKKTVLDSDKLNELNLEINTIGGVLMNEYLNKK